MKGLEVQQHADVMETARKVVSERRVHYASELKAATQYWKRALADEIADRLIDDATMTLEQMADVYRRVNEALD